MKLTYWIFALINVQHMQSAALLVPSNSALALPTLQVTTFNNFLRSFDLELAAPAEFEFRKTIFFAKKAEVEAFNALGRSYLKGLNPLSILTLEEKRKMLGDSEVEPERSAALTARGDGSEPDSAPSADQSAVQLRDALFTPFKLFPFNLFNFISPQKKDFAAENKVTPVKNQKSCGSCWGFAATAVVEAAHKIKTGATLDLAEQELVDCSHQLGSGGCGGGLAEGALQYFVSKGVHLESAYPYKAANGVCKTFSASSFVKKISSYVEVPPGNMLSYLANLSQRPLTTSFYVVNDFFDYASGVFDADIDCASIPAKTNHAVLAVGFDLTVAKPYVKFKNSWGSGWGDSGFFKLPIKKVISQNGPCNMIRLHRAFYPILS